MGWVGWAGTPLVPSASRKTLLPWLLLARVVRILCVLLALGSLRPLLPPALQPIACLDLRLVLRRRSLCGGHLLKPRLLLHPEGGAVEASLPPPAKTRGLGFTVFTCDEKSSVPSVVDPFPV